MGSATKGKIVIDVAGDNSLFVQVVKQRTLDERGYAAADSYTAKDLEKIKASLKEICSQEETRVEIPKEVAEKLGGNVIRP